MNFSWTCITPVATMPWMLISLSAASNLISSLQETYEAKRKEFLLDLQRKEEEMRQMFVNKVKETEAELKEKEKEVRTDVSWNQSLELCLVTWTDCLTLHVVSSSTRGLSSSNACTRRKRRLWRRKDGSWRRRWTRSIAGRLQLRRWWDRRSKAARSPSKRTRTRRSKSARLCVCDVAISENNIASHKTRPFRRQLWSHCEPLLRQLPRLIFIGMIGQIFLSWCD